MYKTTTVDVKIFAVTEKAILCSDTGEKDEAVWVPISQIENNQELFEIGKETTIEIPEWLAEEKGFI